MPDSVLPTPRTPDPHDAPVLRWGVLGPGAIAGDFADALRQHTGQRVIAVGSRNAGRARTFAAPFEVPRVHVGYEALVGDPEVDVVYIATPHGEHARNALLAIAAGKHVLVEKPVAVTAAQARSIFEAAAAAGVFAMEAMWTRFLPQTDVVAQVLERGGLGALSLAIADFGGGGSADPTSRLLDPAQGGGALLDLGVYVAWWSHLVLGAPDRVTARGRLGATGVDEQAALVLETGAAQGVVTAGFHGRTAWRASAVGEVARIEVAAPFWAASGLTLVGADGAVRDTWEDRFGRPYRQGLCYEAAAVARAIAEGRTEHPDHPPARAVAVLETLDAARHQLGYTDPPAWSA
ncbi:MAG TPA: Gfo/Idh/MocA family oxidoreductase [Amnibacterium sp.]|jgi:predicted dehydrogenase|nr:Gfo/Idh/MocA family oxidoreductase [Amnibacterium sp.]